MIKTFPDFTPLDAKLRSEITKICSQFEPYSDFNFTSLLCWDTDGSTSVSLLEGNLVIRLPDYLSGKPVYSIIGENNIDGCISELLKVAKHLELVPESTVKKIQNPESYLIKEDLDQFDYIYSLADHATLAGGRFKTKRKLLARYLNTYGNATVISEVRLDDPFIKEQVESTFDRWASQKSADGSDKQERKALLRLLQFSDELKIKGYLVTVAGKVAGFSITEVVDAEFAIYHFQKTLREYPHLDIYLTKISSEQLREHGCTYINWEQDLGIEGLRSSKQGYQPAYTLKKYSISFAEV